MASCRAHTGSLSRRTTRPSLQEREKSADRGEHLAAVRDEAQRLTGGPPRELPLSASSPRATV